MMDAENLTQMLHNKMAAEHQRPVYRHSGEYAREHGELDVFRASRQANVACREGIEAAIQAGFDGMYLHVDVKSILAEFGPERVAYVLAATIQSKEWDGRFSRSNKAWAAAIPMFETEDRRCAFVVESHPAVLDGFISMVRKEMEAMRKRAEQKPSIKAQLAAEPVPSVPPGVKPKDREVR